MNGTRSTLTVGLAFACAFVPTQLGGVATAAPAPLINLSASGTFVLDGSGAALVDASGSGKPFDGPVRATLSAEDGTLPEPGVCEPGRATLRLDGTRGRFLELASTGNVCGQWVQPPTSLVTHVFTGRYTVTSSSQHRLVGTDGWHEVRLAEDGRASTTAVDT